jgi:hypothetical protein
MQRFCMMRLSLEEVLIVPLSVGALKLLDVIHSLPSCLFRSLVPAGSSNHSSLRPPWAFEVTLLGSDERAPDNHRFSSS